MKARMNKQAEPPSLTGISAADAPSADFLQRWSDNKWVSRLCAAVILGVIVYVLWTFWQAWGAGSDHWRELSPVAASIGALVVVAATFAGGVRVGAVLFVAALACLGLYQTL